jgi:hypothetical protein
MQQILAYETDLLDYGDIFDGSDEIAHKVDDLKRQAKEELKRIEEMGGAVAAVDTGYMKQQLVESNTARLAASKLWSASTSTLKASPLPWRVPRMPFSLCRRPRSAAKSSN